ncbi:DUF4157 domain-containing protein [Rubrolithibacter danxiaensis]|uniref:eCIS core domain-containing protein n=1 Tax=Rubrolithibacter danxiaensis TaxID=3390805 RepID=UPI003BF77C54
MESEKAGREHAGKVPAAQPSSVIQRKCTACQEEEDHLQRKSSAQATRPRAATTASDELSSRIETAKIGGTALSTSTLSFMESRFNADFSGVRIHTNSDAVQLSEELNAHAFTVGNDIYFNAGNYSPETTEGKKLLAHELTHTLQQKAAIRPKTIQRACHDKDNPSKTFKPCPEGAKDVGRQAQDQKNTLDSKAEAIIKTAAGKGDSKDKAIQVVNDIICAYMPGQASKVRKISYFSSEDGLNTQSVGSGTKAQGDICVGDSFLNGTNKANFARRVLQVAHELEHIEQYRTGLAGHKNQHEREFLAFYHEALADEFIGTKRLHDSMRRALIDGALGYYNCLSAELKKKYGSYQQQLLTRRKTVNGTAGNESTEPPKTCKTQ